MPIVNIDPRETQKLVDTGGRWYVEAVNQTVLLDSTATRVRDSGRELDSGAKAHVNLERFNESTLYAFNPSTEKTAQVRIDRQNFELNLFPRRTVESPTEQSARQGNLSGKDGNTVSVGTGDTKIGGYTNNTDETQFVVNHSARIVGGDYDDTVSFGFEVEDAGTTKFVQLRPASRSYVVYDDPIPLEPGENLAVAVNNPTEASIDVDTAATIRES